MSHLVASWDYQIAATISACVQTVLFYLWPQSARVGMLAVQICQRKGIKCFFKWKSMYIEGKHSVYRVWYHQCFQASTGGFRTYSPTDKWERHYFLALTCFPVSTWTFCFSQNCLLAPMNTLYLFIPQLFLHLCPPSPRLHPPAVGTWESCFAFPNLKLPQTENEDNGHTH